MPLILAIEPDKRQSSQLASLVKGLHAELVLRTNAADALTALHGRVPDLVLTTSLISPRDDAALGAHLRELGPAAAHVQTVTIPLLGSAAPQRAKGGMLAALRREKPQAPMTDGCEPAVFAEQVRQYLVTAEEQKVSAATRAIEPERMDAAPAHVEPIAEPIAEPIEQPFEQQFEEPAVVEEIEIAAAAPEADDLVADEPAGLPLSQLLQLVSDAAPVVAAPAVEPPVAITEPVVEPEPVMETAPEPVIEVASEPVIEVASESVIESTPELEAEAVTSFGDLYVDPMAADALDELSRQAPPPSLSDGIPGEPPVPVVEMRSFQSLDAIASELAAGPAQRHESLDELASLFATAPAAPAAPAAVEPVVDFSAPMHGEKSLFASLFAEPAPARASKPVEIPEIDSSLFASPAVEPEPVLATEPAPLRAIEPEPVVALEPEPLVAASEPEPVVSELTVAPALEAAAVEAAEDEFIALEPVEFEPETEAAFEEPVAVAAAPAVDEEIALDVDAFHVHAAGAGSAGRAVTLLVHARGRLRRYLERFRRAQRRDHGRGSWHRRASAAGSVRRAAGIGSGAISQRLERPSGGAGSRPGSAVAHRRRRAQGRSRRDGHRRVRTRPHGAAAEEGKEEGPRRRHAGARGAGAGPQAGQAPGAGRMGHVRSGTVRVCRARRGRGFRTPSDDGDPRPRDLLLTMEASRPFHSARSTRTGSTLAPRAAGIALASNAITASSTAVPTNVDASSGLTSNSHR
jgi:hypothetical protein